MALDIEEVERAAEGVRGWLRSPNIVFVGAGGEDPDDPRIEVRVRRKKKIDEMDRSDIPIPRTVSHRVQGLGGKITVVEIRTDVVECGNLRLLSLNQRWRPSQGGMRISLRSSLFSTHVEAGTLGVNMVWAGRFRMITNNHVISENHNIGAMVYQPEWSVLDNSLARVSGYWPVVTTVDPDAPDQPWNDYDFAYCDVDYANAATNIYEIGQPRGYRAPLAGEAVRWIGYKTGTVKETRIKATHGALSVEWGHGRWARFRRVMTFTGATSQRSQPGDSGAAVVATSDSMVVGLVFSGDDRGKTYACRIPPF